MRLFEDIIRATQRISLDVRNSRVKLRSLIAASLLIVVLLIFTYTDEGSEYTAGSLQMISDKINLLSNKIDSYKMMESHRQETMIPEVPTTTIEETKPTEEIATLSASSSLASPTESVYERENGVIVVFARNADLFKLIETIWSVEQRFNKDYNYPWLILSDSMHTRNFKRTVLSVSSRNVEFYNTRKFNYPSSVDKAKVNSARRKFRQNSVSFRKTLRQRHQNRFWAKDAFSVEPMLKYDYYLRMDPGALFYCDVGFDFFKFMAEHKRTYGFGFAVKGNVETMPTLWENALKFIEDHPKDINKNNMIDFISDDKGESFNACQFRATFEIGDLRFFRSDAYKKLADFLDSKNGIYYEGWDESTFHTLGVTLLEDRHKLQFFNNLGYNDQAKDNMKSCPYDPGLRLGAQCSCDPLDDLTWDNDRGSCIEGFFKVNSYAFPSYMEEYKQVRAEAAERKKQDDEKRKYEQEQLDKEKKQEEEERRKIEEQENANDGEKDGN